MIVARQTPVLSVIQSLRAAVLVNTVGDNGRAQPLANDTMPNAVPLKTAGPPESPCKPRCPKNETNSIKSGLLNP